MYVLLNDSLYIFKNVHQLVTMDKQTLHYSEYKQFNVKYIEIGTC